MFYSPRKLSERKSQDSLKTPNGIFRAMTSVKLGQPNAYERTKNIDLVKRVMDHSSLTST